MASPNQHNLINFRGLLTPSGDRTRDMASASVDLSDIRGIDRTGAVNTAHKLNELISKAGSNNVRVSISDGSYLVQTALTFPVNIEIQPRQGGKLIVDGVTVTINNLEFVGLFEWIELRNGGLVAIADEAVDGVRPQWWGAKADASNDDGPAINAAAVAHRSVFFANGIYNTSVTLNMNRGGSQWIGQSSDFTWLHRTNHTDDQPVVLWQAAGAMMRRIRLGFNSLPTKDSGRDGIRFSDGGDGGGVLGWCILDDVFIWFTSIGISMDQTATLLSVFSTTFSSIRVRRFTTQGIALRPVATGMTGNRFSNIYIGNSRALDTHAVTNMFELLDGAGMHISQLNLEACIVESNQIMTIQGRGGVLFDHIHVEDVTVRPPATTGGRLILVQNQATVTIRALDLIDIVAKETDAQVALSNFALVHLAATSAANQPAITIHDGQFRGTETELEATANFLLIRATNANLDVDMGASVVISSFRSSVHFDNVISATDPDILNTIMRYGSVYSDNGVSQAWTQGFTGTAANPMPMREMDFANATLQNLVTADPLLSDRVWNNGGVLMMSTAVGPNPSLNGTGDPEIELFSTDGGDRWKIQKMQSPAAASRGLRIRNDTDGATRAIFFDDGGISLQSASSITLDATTIVQQRLAVGEPADASVPDGDMVFYLSGSDLRAKKNTGGVYTNATLGTFA